MGYGLHLPSRRRRGEGQRECPGRSCCCSRCGSRYGSPGGKAGGSSVVVLLLRERGVVSIGDLVAVGRNGWRREVPRPELSLGLETFLAVVLYCIAYRIV